jgi:hypothetical protein
MVTNCGMLHNFFLSPNPEIGKKGCPEIRIHWMLAQRLGFTSFRFSNPEIAKKDYAPSMSMTTCFNFLCMPTD